MQTRAFVSLIEDLAPDYGTEHILEIINEVQKSMLNHPLRMMEAVDPATGKAPKITLTSDKKVYQIGVETSFPFDAWRVFSIYQSDPSESIGFTCEDNVDGGATITITEQVTGRYSVGYWKEPTELTSVNIPLSVPSKYHFRYLKTGVIAAIEENESGVSGKWQEFERLMVPKFWAELNRTYGLSSNRRGAYE